MFPPYVLSLRPDLTLHEEPALQRIILDWPDGQLEIDPISPALSQVLRLLAGPGGTTQQLAALVPELAGEQGESELDLCLGPLADSGLLQYTVRSNDLSLVTAIPISSDFQLPSTLIAEDQRYILSRFAWCRRESEQWVLEASLSHAQIHLPSWQGVALLSELRQPHTSCELQTAIPGISQDVIQLFISLLAGVAMLSPVDENGCSAEDQNISLIHWEFHDLLFHTRSRLGRHQNPLGGTYRFLGHIDPLPAIKPTSHSAIIPLYTPDIPSLIKQDRPFTEIIESRRSIRESGETPISDRQLGEFLYRSARVKERWNLPPDPQELTRRPYPGGGAIYELELYVIVERCLNLAAGLYHYDPFAHQLLHLSSGNPHIDELLDLAQQGLISKQRPQILIILTARHQRLAWKYEAMAYATHLKNVGVLFQTMYLVATAMNLAPCAMGSGNSDQFAKAAGLDYYSETSVGEFALSSRGSGELSIPRVPGLS